MNRIECLPEDIIEKIFHIEHTMKFNRVMVNIVEDRRNLEIDTMIGSIFFSSNMTTKDIHNWYLYKRWINIYLDHPRNPRWLNELTFEFNEKLNNCEYVILYKKMKQLRRFGLGDDDAMMRYI